MAFGMAIGMAFPYMRDIHTAFHILSLEISVHTFQSTTISVAMGTVGRMDRDFPYLDNPRIQDIHTSHILFLVLFHFQISAFLSPITYMRTSI
jgi:hypothetical protein